MSRFLIVARPGRISPGYATKIVRGWLRSDRDARAVVGALPDIVSVALDSPQGRRVLRDMALTISQLPELRS